MKIVVIGGSGLIGSQLVRQLRERGHEVTAASPSSGVNTLTGEGLAAALAGAETVVDVSNSPSFADGPVMEFFTVSTKNLLAAEAAAGVRHHVALSVVGADRLLDSGYMRAKVAQEGLIASGPTPYTILRATQFFEFLAAIVDAGTADGTARLTSAKLQPVAASDVVAALREVALASPANRMVEIAGPEARGLDDLGRQLGRTVVTDDMARYFGALLDDSSLTPGANPMVGATPLAAWLEARQ
ncbi:MAG TPA: SDR family oxidoreductase [Bryobacteraceae bacterium]|nr:SDR family oxidoreductase [Bryobacteraceae bacterium]